MWTQKSGWEKKEMPTREKFILLSMYACICANNMTPSDPIKVSRLSAERAVEKTNIKYSTAMYSIKIYFQGMKKKNEHTHIQTTIFFIFSFGNVARASTIFRMREWRKFSTFFLVFFFASTCVCKKLCLTFFCRSLQSQIRHHMVYIHPIFQYFCM